MTILKKVFKNIIRILKLNKKSYVSLFSLVDEDSIISENVKIYRFNKIRNTFVGKYTYISSGCSFKNTNIGKFCSIAKDVKAGMGKHPTDYVSTSPYFYSTVNALGSTLVTQNSYDEYEEINIGNDVWIGVDALILDGVTVGDGAIIAAKSLVNKDVPPYAIVGGVPAKLIRYRFSEKQIANLLNISWWNLSAEELKSRVDSFSDVDAFIETFD